MFKNITFGFFVAMILAACSSTNNGDPNLYLRSEFTYWEAKEEYQFKQASSRNKDVESYFVVESEIVADGNPYHLKIADKSWSKNNNCGYRSVESKDVILGEWIELQCDYDFEKEYMTPIQRPLDFLPKDTGKYRFTLRINQDAKRYLRVELL